MAELPLLIVKDLVKRYRQLTAVDGVSFNIPAGTCFGLLGPNGAGKTTTVEMLEGINQPSAGEILYKGNPLGRTFKQEAGIMFQSTSLQEYITVRETLALFAALYERTRPLDELIEQCNLGEFLDRDNHRLSGGQRQRLLLAIALINDPHLVYLDEPTTGLDPQARHNFWELIETIKAEGKTVILTTHYMDEAYRLCDEIAIMDRGRIIAQGSPKALLAKHFNDVILQLPRVDLGDHLDAISETVLDCGEAVEILTGDVDHTIAELLEVGVTLSNLQIRARTLDDLFLELTGKEIRG